MSNDGVRYEVRDQIATITLDRPEAMNSLDWATKEALVAAVGAAATDDAVRCVVLTGTGRAFCVGQDLKEHIKLLEDDPDGAMAETVGRHYNPIVTALATMPKPVVAAVNGVAAGAGASLAFACDLRVLSESAGFNLAFTGVALSCDTGSSWTLPRLVGRAKAMELLYFPSTVKADDALRLGLATQVVPAEEFEATVADLAARLASGPTLSYASIRQSVNYASDHSLEEAAAFERDKMALTGSTQDHLDAVAAFVAKQRPTFHGR